MNKHQAEKLLESLDQRTQPDALKQAKSKQVVLAHWRQAVSQNRRRRFQKLAVAASVVFTVAVMSLWLLAPDKITNSQLLQSFSVQGNVLLHSEYIGTHALKIDTQLAPGETVVTGNDGAVIWLLNDGSELRQGPDTHITWLSDNHIQLTLGRLYHDTDLTNTAGTFIITTRLGDIQHIGTRYAVNQDANNVQVAVRNGRVTVLRDSQQKIIQTEQLYTVSNDGNSQLKPIKSYDEAIWTWAFQAQKPYPLNGLSLYEFIQWFAHENALEVDWNNQQNHARTVHLQGTIQNMTPQTALKTVFASTKFNYQIDKGRLQISQP